MSMPPRRYVLVLSAALLLRVLWALWVPVAPFSDSHAYDVLAQNVANGTGYGWRAGEPTANWVPGTAFVYAVLYRLFGYSYTPIVIMNILLGGWIVVAAMWLAEKWLGRRVGIVTGLLLAFWLQLIQFTTLLASELLFMALVLAALIVLQTPLRVWWQRALFLGILLAAATYVRSIGLVLVVLFLPLEYVRTRSWRTSAAAFVVVGVVVLVLLAPWSVRNTLAFGQFTLLATDSGAVVWGGTRSDPEHEMQEPMERPPGLNEAQLDHYWMGLALDRIRADPLAFGVSIFRRWFHMHSRESIGVVWNQEGLTSRFGAGVLMLLKALNTLYWFAALGLAMIGGVLLVVRRRWQAVFNPPALLLSLGLVGILAVFTGQDRYHVPEVPFVAMLAAYTLVTVRERLAARKA